MTRPSRPPAFEVALTVCLGVIFLASAVAAEFPGRALDGLGWALLLANTLPLLALRRSPLLVLFVLALAYPAWAWNGYPTHLLQSLPVLVALAAVGAAPKPLWWRALGLLAPAEMMGFVLVGIWGAPVLEIGYVAIVFCIVWGLGVTLADRRAYARALEEKTAALEAAREELAGRAVSEERARIARDLHDIVGHAMSVITVQAGVGAHLLDRDPEQAERALRNIEETGRNALGEMRRMLGVLHPDDAGSPRQQTDINGLHSLVAQVEAAGTPVSLKIEGETRSLPPGLELTAYRIAQEALTNIVRHAPGAQARVTLRYKPEWLELDISDIGGSSDPAPNPSGQGLQGMRERVSVYGGTFEAGPSNGGFRVQAKLRVEAP
jgi:signal transduction histidine kinase